jgi:hypothetical protein
MANIKTTPKQWEKAREYFEAGLSLDKVVERTGISKTQLSKRKNLEGWSKGTEKEQLLIDATRLAERKGIFLSPTGTEIHDELLNERTSHLKLINNATHINVNRMMRKFDPKSKEYQKEMTIMENKLVQSTIKDARESLLGKDIAPPTVINNNNNSAPGREELLERLRQIDDFRRSIVGSS